MLVKKPKLWWPNGHGNPALYDLFLKTGSDPFFRLSHTMHKKIGFRELRVVSEEDDIGRSFKFVVNGKDIFAKGANWIPADALPSRWTRARIAGLLDSAVQAHMNCLRVWGGGRYESDDFYELCDERGIMIWQDCMFSCALYPSSPEFLSNVEAEITHQVKRLSDHPSIALWCGNNEALGAITWYEESKKNPARYIADYDRLTEGILGRLIRALDPDRCFWPSSPSAGPNDFSDNWHSDERGDMHFWSVWHEGKPFSEYLTVQPRFCSEFGFQAFPSMRTIESFAPPEERNISAPALEAHQKHPRGNSLILDTMLRYFRLPKGFHELVYLSQVQQAMAIRTAVEYWRSTMPRCMGTLYWQLNDVWPAVSWSSLNYDGTWKLLHYEARRFYAPVILALFIKDGAIQAHIISEIPGEHAATIILQLLDFHGEQRGLLFKDSVSVTSNSSQRVWHMPVSELPCKPEEVYIEASLDIPDLGISTLSALFLTEPKRCNLADPGLEVTLAANANGQIEATVYASKAPAFYVALEIEGLAGQFEDAGFYCAQGTRKKVAFIQEERGETRNYASLAEQQPQAEAHAISQTNATLQARLRAFHLQNSFEH
jgi:beta-mannosidase